MRYLIEVLKFIFTRKKYWIAPVLIILLILGGLLVVSQGSSVAPFIYTIFVWKIFKINLIVSLF